MRATVPLDKVAEAVEKISEATVSLSTLRGRKCLASNYEILGVIMEELNLYANAVMRGDQAAIHAKLIGVARTATFGIACQLAKTVDS